MCGESCGFLFLADQISRCTQDNPKSCVLQGRGLGAVFLSHFVELCLFFSIFSSVATGRRQQSRPPYQPPQALLVVVSGGVVVTDSGKGGGRARPETVKSRRQGGPHAEWPWAAGGQLKDTHRQPLYRQCTPLLN